MDANCITEDIHLTKRHTYLEDHKLASRGLGLGLRQLACWDCVFEFRREQSVSCKYCVLSGRGLWMG